MNAGGGGGMDYNYARYSLEAYELGKFPGPKPGEMAPDFTLHTMEGKEVRLADLKGKWVVLETGSYTCPMYVLNAPSMNALKPKFPDVEFLLVYVREAHPGSRIGPHTDMETKAELAKKLGAAPKETREILIDDVPGTMHRAYGAFPNLVYVLNPEGRVVYRLDWSSAKRVEAFLRNRDTINTDDHRQIWTAPPWIMVPVCLRGGWNAVWDLAIETPTIIWGHIKVDVAHFLKRRSAKKP